MTLHNFGNLLHNNVSASGNGKADAPYLSWILNSMIVAGATALLTTMLGALGAYAFSRFRFKGRRMGMMTLLLIQMFPQFGAIAAIYLLVLHVGNIFHPIGLNTLLGVIVVYLGGAMGVQAWLMKGFFDTIPQELDESARVDGATAAQIFWGVVLPLAAPVLVVVGLIAFVFTLNEFVIASALLQTNDHFTLPVGMQGFISQQYGQRWGPFAAGSLMAMIPVTLLFLFLQKWIVSGLTAGASRDERSHRRGRCSTSPTTTAASCTSSNSRTNSGAMRRCASARARGAADRVLLRYSRDGEPRTAEAIVDEESETETWWRATFPVANPATRYRWLLAGGETGYGWLTGNGVVRNEVPYGGRLRLSLGTWPDWHRSSVVYEIFPDRFAASGATRTPPDWAVPRAWDELPTGRGPATPREWFGGDLPGIEQHLDHIESLGANAIYLTPIFPASSTHRTTRRASTGRPAARR